MLDVDPKVPATVIIEHLRRDGYEGGITILKDYLVQVRPLFVQARSYQRTSYLPGEVGHTDWWEAGVSEPVGSRATREMSGLASTLPHSAAKPSTGPRWKQPLYASGRGSGGRCIRSRQSRQLTTQRRSRQSRVDPICQCGMTHLDPLRR